MKNGNFFWRVNGVRWFTNLDHKKRHEEIILYEHYTPEKYPKYDNYDAINIDKVTEIPCDYEGEIGVPISFMDKYNPEQFKIIGSYNNSSVTDKESEGYVLSSNTPAIVNGKEVLWNGPVINKKTLYKRIIIRRKK
ncbi:MAG: adenine-specific methyltransferase EcoRI family protein [Treponema sp.]